MTIHVTCECGKQLHAPDEFAGRQTRCPVCKRPVMLPSPETAIQPTPSPTPAMASPEVETAAFPVQAPAGGQATSKLALWSLILGVASVCVPCFLSIPAVILGILGLREMGRDPQLGGKGMAIAGLIIGCISTVLILPFILIVCLGAITTMGTSANSTFQTVGNSLSGS